MFMKQRLPNCLPKASEIIRVGQERVHIGLDYFDGTINRIAAWTVGTRNMQKALCKALLEPAQTLQDMENRKDYTKRLVLTEELKALPFQAVYDYFCLTHQTPVGYDVMQEIQDYEKQVLAKR